MVPDSASEYHLPLIQENTMSDVKLTALVTGASAGLGAEYCRQLADRCDVIIAVARRGDRLQALAEELKDKTELHCISADLTTIEGVTRTLEALRQKGPVDYLVNNAGFGTWGKFNDSEIGREAELLSILAETPMRLTRGAVPFMKERGQGWIINVASVGAFSPLPMSAVYAASKAFLLNLSRSLQAELTGSGVAVQCLCPGLVHTEIHSGEGFANFDKARTPAEAWMHADEVVSISLAALDSGKLLVVPGEGNQQAVRAMLEQQLALLD
jgi:short-subunit dehydrogenase